MKPVLLVTILASFLFTGAAAGAASTVDTPTTFTDAMRWYKRAAEAGSANAQFFLGRMYETGRNRKLNLEMAAFWYRKAAEQGHRLAQYRLGQMYFSGAGVARDRKGAAKWFELAAGQGLREAQFDLGYLYDRGLGLAASPGLAAQWYRKAAEQGLGQAQYNLGILLVAEGAAGAGAGDVVEGWVWLSMAAEQAVAGASDLRAHIEKQMSEAELAQARLRLAAQNSEKKKPGSR